METVNYPKRNEDLAINVLRGKSFESGKNKDGKNVIVVAGKACACSDAAFTIIDGEQWDKLNEVQYFEFQVNDKWIPCFCKRGMMANAKQHTLPADL